MMLLFFLLLRSSVELFLSVTTGMSSRCHEGCAIDKEVSPQKFWDLSGDY